MSGNHDDYMIDVAKEHTYQNQNSDYTEAYLKWRKNEKNRFGYTFEHDSREHTYVKDEGFVDKRANDAEKSALKSCCTLLGIALIIMQLVYVAEIWYDANNKELIEIGGFNLTRQNIKDARPLRVAIIISAFHIARFLIPIIIFAIATRLPKKVCMPSSKGNGTIITGSINIMLLVLVFGRFAAYLLSKIFEKDYFTLRFYSLLSDNPTANVIFFVCEYIVVAVLMEIFFRGYVLQTFRQFGEVYAIAVTCIAESFFYFEMSNLMCYVFAAIIFSLFTIRTGSIWTAVWMRISVNLLYFIFILTRETVSETYMPIMESGLAIVVIVCTLVSYNRLMNKSNWSFNISDSKTELTFGSMIKSLIGNVFVLAYIIVTLIIMFAMRIL